MWGQLGFKPRARQTRYRRLFAQPSEIIHIFAGQDENEKLYTLYYTHPVSGMLGIRLGGMERYSFFNRSACWVVFRLSSIMRSLISWWKTEGLMAMGKATIWENQGKPLVDGYVSFGSYYKQYTAAAALRESRCLRCRRNRWWAYLDYHHIMNLTYAWFVMTVLAPG